MVNEKKPFQCIRFDDSISIIEPDPENEGHDHVRQVSMNLDGTFYDAFEDIEVMNESGSMNFEGEYFQDTVSEQWKLEGSTQ